MALRLLLLPVLLVQAWMALVSAYLALLAVASFFYRREGTQVASRSQRFAVLVPAHNEEASLPRLLRSLAATDYPAENRDFYVVADNCTDGTAGVARMSGAVVFERFDVAQRGKGYALKWLMERLDLGQYDAVVIIDADTVVSPNLFEAASEAMDGGHDLLQVYNGVLNREESPAAGLRALAFDLHNRVRVMGKDVLGISTGLLGNGMVIGSRVLRAGAWDSFGLAEDAEAHAHLVARGERVRYVDAAKVLSDMPGSLAASEGQNVRWEAGHIDVARRQAPGLLGLGLRQRSWGRLVTALDLIIPPQSAQILLVITGMIAAPFGGSRLWRRLAFATVVGQVIYLSAGLLRLGRGGARLGLLLHVPQFVAWKLWLYTRVLAGRGSREWTRGHRPDASETRDDAAVAAGS